MTTLAQSAFIKLVPASTQTTITLAEVENLLTYYRDITTKTGDQLSWEYKAHAFPYALSEKRDGDMEWLTLKGKDDTLYKYILIGVGTETTEEENAQSYIQIVLPDQATYADKNKANEFAKFFAKKLSGELHLFNGRVMYYYKKK